MGSLGYLGTMSAFLPVAHSSGDLVLCLKLHLERKLLHCLSITKVSGEPLICTLPVPCPLRLPLIVPDEGYWCGSSPSSPFHHTQQPALAAGPWGRAVHGTYRLRGQSLWKRGLQHLQTLLPQTPVTMRITAAFLNYETQSPAEDILS